MPLNTKVNSKVLSLCIHLLYLFLEFISSKKRQQLPSSASASTSTASAVASGVEIVKIFLKNGVNQTAALNESHTYIAEI